MTSAKTSAAILKSEDMHSLLKALANRQFNLFGPTIGDSAVVYEQIHTVDDLPVGWSDSQDAATYRLAEGRPSTFFDYVVGPQSWKKFLHPPVQKLLDARRDSSGCAVTGVTEEPIKAALIGVRSCELEALAIHDIVLTQGPYIDKLYQQRRHNLFVVAVNCVRPGGTCFCTSMKTGPRASSGFDLALTEILETDRHYFLVESGSETGARLLSELPVTEATAAELDTAEKILTQSAERMGRSLDTEGIKDLMYRHFDDPYWNEVADRCLSCGNCTSVCPTCFCVDVQDVTDLTGHQAERWSQWDSCYTRDFSYIHGGSIRSSAMSRYRQWITHKLAYWHDQFGSSGCVGCGRCITWCPAAIDITEEVRAIRDKEREVET